MNKPLEQVSVDAPADKPARRIAPRIIFGVALAIGMASGWFVMSRQKANRQLQAVTRLRQLGCQVYLNYQWDDQHAIRNGRPPEAAWLRRLVGDAMLDRAVAVKFESTDDPSAAIAELTGLPYLEYLDASDTPISDDDLIRIGRLHTIRHLDLGGTRITDAGLTSLAGLWQMESISLADTKVSDKGLGALNGLKRLKHFDLSETKCAERR